MVALNTHDKNFICQEWLWHQIWKPIPAQLFEIQISRQNQQPIREQEEKPAGFPLESSVPKILSDIGKLKTT